MKFMATKKSSGPVTKIEDLRTAVDPERWSEQFLRDVGVSRGDRTSCELRVLVSIFKAAGEYDQLNLGEVALQGDLCYTDSGNHGIVFIRASALERGKKLRGWSWLGISLHQPGGCGRT